MKILNLKKLILSFLFCAIAILMLSTLKVNANDTDISSAGVVVKNNRDGSTGKQSSDAFITTWNMNSGVFTLLTQSGTYNAVIDWGDGTAPTSHTSGDPTHTYDKAGEYRISITGQYNGFKSGFADLYSKATGYLVSVNNWGNVGFSNSENEFAGCFGLAHLPEVTKQNSDAFITTWNITKNILDFTLYSQSGTYNATIDWGDGSTSSHTSGDPTHTYSKPGTYQISITGQYNGLCMGDSSNKIAEALCSVDNWGNVGFTSFENAFSHCRYQT